MYEYNIKEYKSKHENYSSDTFGTQYQTYSLFKSCRNYLIQHYWYSILLDRTVLNDKFKKKIKF